MNTSKSTKLPSLLDLTTAVDLIIPQIDGPASGIVVQKDATALTYFRGVCLRILVLPAGSALAQRKWAESGEGHLDGI